MNEYLEFAKDISFKAKEVMLTYFNEENVSSYKDDDTIVTVADKIINDYLIEQVKKVYPNHAVYGEEKSFGESDYVWVCDPIDGTAMYARGILVATFSLALVYKGEVIIGVVMDPFNDCLYTAVKGRGAYKNDKKISVSDYSLTDKRSVGYFDMYPQAEYDLYDVVKVLNQKCYNVSLGSIVRGGILVSEGKFIFSLFPGTVCKNCDIAAVKLIVEEAGGIVRNLKGEEQYYNKDISGAIISNKVVYNELLEIINDNIKIKGSYNN